MDPTENKGTDGEKKEEGKEGTKERKEGRIMEEQKWNYGKQKKQKKILFLRWFI